MNVFAPLDVRSILDFTRPGPLAPTTIRSGVGFHAPNLFIGTVAGKSETIVEYVDREVLVEVPVVDVAREGRIARSVAKLTSVALLTAGAKARGASSVVRLT